MDMFVLGAVAILAAMTGFWLGKSLQWYAADEEEAENVRMILKGREISSPVAGQVSMEEENGKKRLRIVPEQGKLYAPASGRISRLYPMGCAMLLKTEFGAEILMKAGDHVDEMFSEYYRCRVMEHEFVKKGALLMEYDPAAISAEGADPEVFISVENEDAFAGVAAAAQKRTKVGEPLLYVSCADGVDIYGELLEKNTRQRFIMN